MKLEEYEKQKYFYLKDISAHSGSNLEIEDEDNLLNISEDEMQKILSNRKKQNFYGDAKE